MKRLECLAALAAAVVLASLALRGQTPAPPAGRAVITGRVVDEYGDPAIGVPVLTHHVSELSTVMRDSTRTAPEAAVFVFPTDRDLWYPDSRFMRRTTSGTDASFSVSGLPFWSYYVASLERLPLAGGSDWQDPEFLESLVTRAMTVTLAEGRKETLRVQQR